MSGGHDKHASQGHAGEHTHDHAHPHAPPSAAESGPGAELPQGAGHGRLLYLDAGSGLAGDMLVAALIDLGVPEGVVRHALAGLGLTGYRVHVGRTYRASIAVRQFDVEVLSPQPARDYRTIAGLIEDAHDLRPGARAIALGAFERLGRAEAQVHACDLQDVHFHEVGAVDSIVDIVAAAVAFDYLGADVECSALPLGRGSTHAAHGVIPLPAPATVLCLQGVPTYDAGISAELVTPTGACLVAQVARRYGQWPTFRPERVGMSAGKMQWPDRPNLLRAVLGSPEPQGADATHRQGLHVVLEANIDDMTPELVAFALQQLLQAGALDAWTTPIGMKKGRSAITLSALCARQQLACVVQTLLSETTTLGVRYHAVDRVERPRTVLSVPTAYGPIDVKVAQGDGIEAQIAPEYESCVRAAQAHGVPVRRVYAAALAAFEAQRTHA